ncbi:MAG: 2-hydroxyacyl-CoA dehydratase, partial [Lachnoanaerobaculum sp.]|nr:2-hydroxyacyl-CoA dehydratase [Lachnoanaerobaculum sp.]
FYNDAVLRALEKISGGFVTRPDIAGIMGAFGAALIARERYEGKQTTMLSLDDIISLQYDTSMTRCRGCNNNCVMTVNKFEGGRNFISGNRCERGLGKDRVKKDVPNLYEYKYNRMFGYEPLTADKAFRGTIGIPRVLNMYENFPFWAVFFRNLGFRTVLSPMSTKKIYELGIESIPSESECYPAKITHGHISWLIKNGVRTIWYPCIPYERNEQPDAGNHFNCPIVTSYAENIKNNVEEIRETNTRFLNPFMAFTNEEVLTNQLIKVMKQEFDINEREVKFAAHAAWTELIQSKKDIEREGEKTIEWLHKNNRHGIVLAGRPYHVDPEIHHGIPDMITSFGIAVLTEDAVSHLAKIERPVIVSDQWMYHSRLYAAASLVKQDDCLDLVQLNSFGCGLDAVTTDQVSDILTGSGKIYTVLKIDEVNNLGAARIRIRSLIAALRVRDKKNFERKIKSSAYHRKVFTKEMKDEYTILCPQMSPIHFDLLEPALNAFGYHVEVLQNDSRSAIDCGLKYVNNDACYPSLIVVGQIMEALLSGKYDPNKTAIFMSQTGGGCRASNYIGFIRRALEKVDMEQIPVISVNANGMETNEGFKMTPAMIIKAMQAVVYGDLFMRVLYATRPYEKERGAANRLHKKWRNRVIDSLSVRKPNFGEFKRNIRAIVKDFDNLPRLNIKKPRVGIVGEILVKFSPLANNHIVDLLEKEGAEAVMPDLLDFLLYSFYNSNFKAENLGMSKKSAFMANVGIKVLEALRSDARKALDKSKHFIAPSRIDHLANMAKDYVSVGNQTGEGWFLTGEMLELIETGTPNIVCTQPFGCLPNHVVGKGVIKELRRSHPEANIIAVDYDPGASEVNQLNRIKLMLATAQKNLKEQNKKVIS